eukprot:6175162-Pleurochrysis_carterae.AAC.3
MMCLGLNRLLSACGPASTARRQNEFWSSGNGDGGSVMMAGTSSAHVLASVPTRSVTDCTTTAQSTNSLGL